MVNLTALNECKLAAQQMLGESIASVMQAAEELRLAGDPALEILRARVAAIDPALAEQIGTVDPDAWDRWASGEDLDPIDDPDAARWASTTDLDPVPNAPFGPEDEDLLRLLGV